MVGRDYAPKRQVPAWLFEYAPRLHSGLAADEYPAILQRGEQVIPRGGAQNLNVKLEVINESGMPMRVSKKQTSVDAEGLVVKAWLSAFETNRYGLRTMLGA